MPDLPVMLVPIFFFLSIAAVLIVYLTVRHRERMSMIEKGLTPTEVKEASSESIRREPSGALKWGLLILAVGLGLFVGNLLEDYLSITEGVKWGIILLFAGAALVLYYSIASKKKSDQEP